MKVYWDQQEVTSTQTSDLEKRDIGMSLFDSILVEEMKYGLDESKLDNFIDSECKSHR